MKIPPAPSADATFPPDFRFGCATSSFQVEGAVAEDGRGPSVWDTYSERPGTIMMDHHARVAADFYHRFPEDIAFMKWLGLDMFRLSIAWPRILPEGRGRVNEAGLAFYDRLIDQLLAAGIEPWVTLFHWDLPDVLETQHGGWTSPDLPRYFADYVSLVAARLSDRVSHFFTINEFGCFLDNGYIQGGQFGWFAPGRVVDKRTLNQTRHHGLLAHGLAVQALRAAAKRPLRIGLAENPTPAIPILATDEHIAAARTAFRDMNAHFLTAVLEGKYTERYLREQGSDAPRFTDAEMAAIASPLDFVGVNHYGATHVRAAADKPGGWEIVPPGSAYPRMTLDWFTIDPDLLYWTPRFLKELWNVPEVYISENGCCATDTVSRDGQILDTDRIFFLRQHLRSAARAVAEGWPLKGYFQWSLIDSFEWAYGYTKRFGLGYVNYQTLQRTPKLSAHFYREVVARHQVV